MPYFMIMPPDLDELGMGLELDGQHIRLTGAAGKEVFDPLMSAVVAFENIGYDSGLAVPFYASTEFRAWYQASELSGLAFEPAHGGVPGILAVVVHTVARSAKKKIDATSVNGASFFYVNAPGMLFCDAAAAAALEASDLGIEVQPADPFLR